MLIKMILNKSFAQTREACSLKIIQISDFTSNAVIKFNRFSLFIY